MIHGLSKNIAEFYGDKEGYTQDKIEVCTYGLELIISDIIAIFIVMIAAVFTNTVLYTITLLLVFASIRLQAGGFHAPSHLKCNLLFFAAYAVSVLLVKFIPINITKYLISIMNVISIIEIIMYAPVAHPNKPVSKKKKKKCRYRSLIMAIVFSVASIILSLCLPMSQYAIAIALGLFWVGLSIMSETLKQKRVTK